MELRLGNGSNMLGQVEQMRELASALELQVELRAEAAKRAIREYKQSIREEPGAGGARRSQGQRELKRVVEEYIQSRKRLDEIRAEISTRAR